uniref:Phospholipid-transporting ATPase n=1 Tax=Branchiostoma floridae TaxID=7739 RepID=C3Y260_BRAFL|eukprot:XP_002609940.1 hypothetical protein BRAFLDRAFT_85893 [Branchiostoma floridae]
MKDCLNCFRKKEEEVERKIRTNDLEYNKQFGYASNYISTSKYNVFTFLPINLFEQLQRVANAYFVILLILQRRHQSDNLVNNRKSQVLRNGTETNLKCRQALVETAELGDDIHSLGQFNGHITCEPPNNKLDKFEGTLEWNGEKFSLCNDQIMLRGCVLRNTQWCYGVVVFAGQDTKLMMNSGQSRFKRTHIDQLMNVIVLWIFGFLVCMALICAIACGVWESYVGQYFRAYLPWEVFTNNPAEIAALVFLSYIIILNTVVPISLYVSVEIIRMGHSLFINWDSKMYYAPKHTPAKARTTTLNEELGQIEYVFSDKTGTLTQNIMAFNKCSINGKLYGDVYDKDGNPMDITEFTKKVDFSGNVYSDKSFTFYDQTLLDDIQKGDENVTNFFRLLALCHTVMPEEKNGLLEYQAQSPDEGALVSAAKNFGIVFLARTPNTITIKDQDKDVTYELLHILDFNNVRKRMSVIVRTTDGKLLLLCKGADSIIYEHLSQNCSDLQTVTTEHLNKFACDGLRTLCLASKELDPNFYEEWKSRHHEASTSLEDRDEKLDVVYEEIEQDMMLLGATAIEDKLQDGVPDTIANLADANMKIWVLTGDKQETAINIGYSCNMLTDDMEDVFIVGAHSKEEVRVELANAFKKIKDMVGCRDVMIQDPRATSMVDMGDKEFALVINGHSLIGLDTAYWTGINHLFIWGSIAWYFGASLIVYSDGLYKLALFPFVGVARNVFGQPTLWFTVLLTVLVCLLPVMAIRFLMRDLRPTLSDRIRLAQQLSKTSKRTTSQLLRRKSSRLSHRPSSRRSGYAFAHQEGFGRLITSGTIKMRQKKIGQRLSEHNLKERASATDLTYDV